MNRKRMLLCQRRILGLLLIALLCFISTGVTAFAKDAQPIGEPDGIAPVGAAPVAVPKIEITTEAGNGASLLKADGYVNAQIRITDTDSSVLSGAVQFKVRGHSTAIDSIQKKAFTFKFAKKTEVLGMGKGKKWALLANCFDPTLLRNYVVFDFAREMGLPYTSQQRIAELWLDGEYRGCYTVYEPVQEGTDRVNIDIDSNDGKKDFLLELEGSRVEDDVTYLTVGGVRFALTDPEEPNEDQFAYITDVMTQLMNTLQNGTEEQIRKKFDIDSFAKFYFMNEYAKTLDFGFSSVFFFYQNGRLYAGPPWDYDLALGNANGDLNSAAAKAGSVPDGIMQNDKNLYRWLCNRDWFQDEVRKVYRQYYDYVGNISSDGGLLDTLREQYADVIARNFNKWSVSRWWLNYQKKPLATYADNFAYLKNWCAERHAWLTEYYDPLRLDPYILGDADDDGKVTVLDATAIQRHLAALTTLSYHEQAADADENGEVDILDATAVQRWLAGFSGHENIGTTIGS